jgi:hypothetical protein
MSAAMAQGGGIPPLVVDVGRSILQNAASAVAANKWLQPIPGRLATRVASWHWLQITSASYIRNSEQVPYFVDLFVGKQVFLGPHLPVQWTKSVGDNFSINVLVRSLPDDFNDTLRTLSRRGVSVVDRPFGLLPSQVWRYSFGLNKISPRLAGHFTVGSLVTGGIADAVIGGLWQGLEDHYKYDLWSTNPGLAWKRVGANAGANATVGAIGTGVTALGFYGAVTFLGMSTPPGLVIVGTTVGVTIAFDLIIGEKVKEGWFKALNAKLPEGY